MVVAYMILVSARTKSLPVKREGSWTWTRTWQYVLLYYIIIVYLFLLRIAPFFSFDQSHWRSFVLLNILPSYTFYNYLR